MAAGSGSVTLTDADNGKTVTVARGATVVVQLASLYWGFPNPPDPSILRPVGSPTLVPAPVGTCVPGGGCGTATATFTAVGAGSTQVSASRTTCGEALLCTGGNGSYAVHVVVQG